MIESENRSNDTIEIELAEMPSQEIQSVQDGADAISRLQLSETEPAHVMCHRHPTRNIEVYCATCRVNICMMCALVEHKSHDLRGSAEEFQQENSKPTPWYGHWQLYFAVIVVIGFIWIKFNHPQDGHNNDSTQTKRNSGNCPEGYYMGSEILPSCYMYVNNANDWETASAVCTAASGGWLAKIDSAEEDEFIYNLGRRGEWKWIGYYATRTPLDFKWSHIADTSTEFENWAVGQPDLSETAANDKCVISGYGTPWGWKNVNCMTKNSFVCEWEREKVVPISSGRPSLRPTVAPIITIHTTHVPSLAPTTGTSIPKTIQTISWTTSTIPIGGLPLATTHVGDRWCAGGAALHGNFYVVGGFAGFRNAVGITEMYDSQQNSWTTKATASYGKFCPTVTATDTAMYFMCGSTSGFIDDRHDAKYDPLLNHWSAIAALPAGVNGWCTTAASQGQVYLAVYERLFEYSPLQNTWKTMEAFPARGSAGAFVRLFEYNGQLHGSHGGVIAEWTAAPAASSPTAGFWSIVTPAALRNNPIPEKMSLDAGDCEVVMGDHLLLIDMKGGSVVDFNLRTGERYVWPRIPKLWGNTATCAKVSDTEILMVGQDQHMLKGIVQYK